MGEARDVKHAVVSCEESRDRPVSQPHAWRRVAEEATPIHTLGTYPCWPLSHHESQRQQKYDTK